MFLMGQNHPDGKTNVLQDATSKKTASDFEVVQSFGAVQIILIRDKRGSPEYVSCSSQAI
jgi:hypothetical protein